MPHHYESLATYTRRQAYLASQEAQAPPVVPQPEPSLGGKFLGGLSRGLSLLGKPLEYTAKGAELLLPGGPPAGEVRGFGDILKARGVPGAGPLGFAADVALDPLNLLFLAPPLSPLALAAKARRGAQAAEGLAPLAGRVMPEFAETAAKIGQPSVARTLAQGIEQIPFIGKPLVQRTVGPAATAKPGTMAHSLVTYERQAEVVRYNVAPRYLSQVTQHRTPFIFDKDQRITNIPGVKPTAFADAFDDPAILAKMTPEQQAYKKVYADAKRPLLQEAVRRGVPGLENEDVITSRLVVGHWEKLPSGGRRFHAVLPEEGIQRARLYDTMEQGIAAGEVYADPVRTLEVKLVEMGDALNTKQLTDYLQQIGLAVKPSQLPELVQPYQAAVARSKALKALGARLRDVRRGLVPSERELQRIVTAVPDIEPELRSLLAVQMPDFQRTLARYTGEIQRVTGIAPRRLQEAIEAARQRRLGDITLGTEFAPGPLGRRAYPLQNVTRVDLQEGLRALNIENDRSIDLLERLYGETFRFKAAERSARIEQLLTRHEELAVGAKVTRKEALEALKVGRQAERERTAGLLGIPEEAVRSVPGSQAFQEIRLDRRDVDALLRHFQDRPGGFTSNVNEIMGSIRSFRTTADASAQLIQGLPLLASKPQLWAKASFESLKSLADAQSRARYIARESGFLARHPDLYVSATEQFEAVRQGMPTARRALALPVIGPVLRGSQRMFDTFGDVARIEWAKAMEPLAKAAGRLNEIDEFANKATGVISRRALGIPASQRAGEGAYLLFATRFTTSALALSGNMLQGGLRGDLARDAVARMLVVGSAFFVKSAKAAGLDDEEIERRLDPTSSSFMTLPVMGMNVGVGGVYVSLAKLVSRIVEEPGQLKDLSVRDPTNPLIRFWRGRAAPGTQYAWDVAVSGQDYLGNPIGSPQEIAAYFLRTTTPIAAGAVAEAAIQEPRRALGALPELVGARTFPTTTTDMRQKIARELFGKPYEALGSVERAQVDRDERIRALPEPPGRFYAESRERSKIFRDYEEEVNTAAQKVFTGHFSKRNFREALAEIRSRRNVLLSQLPEVEQRTPEGKVYVQYINMLKAEPGEDVDFDSAEVFKASLSGEQQDYIDQRLLASDERFADPQVRELLSDLRADRETLRPYWELWEQALERYGLSEGWQEASPAEREALRRERRYKRAQSFVSRQRKRLRRRDPEIDETLIEWGYASAPIRAQGR